MDDWLILSDTPLSPDREGAAARLGRGLFAMEYQLPLTEATVLVDYRAGDPAAFTFSVLHDPEGGLSILLRQDGAQCRMSLPGRLGASSGVARLSLHFDAAQGGVWLLRLALPGATGRLEASGAGGMALDINAFDRLAAGASGSQRHGSVLWFGLSRGLAMPPLRAWLGRNTPVATLRGTVLAEGLRPGDRVIGLDSAAHEVTAISRIEVPSRGSFAPVLLRCPFFGANIDLLVSSDQLVLVGGTAVEYMFGAEEVLLRAGALVNGRAAMFDNRRASTLGITIDCGEPVILPVNGVGLLAPGGGGPLARAPRRVLTDYEAHPLIPLIEPGGMRRAH